MAGGMIVGFAVLKRAVMLFVACAIVLAVVKSVPHDDTSSLVEWARVKAEQVKVWSDKTSETIVDGTENLPEPGGILPDPDNTTPSPQQSESGAPPG